MSEKKKKWNIYEVSHILVTGLGVFTNPLNNPKK